MSKTNEGLMDEWFAWFLKGKGASEAQVKMMVSERKQRFPCSPYGSVVLSDSDFNSKLEALKKESPAFLNYLATTDFKGVAFKDSHS